MTLFPWLVGDSEGELRRCTESCSRIEGSSEHHHVEAFGLIDGDARTEPEIRSLEANNVFALPVCSAESLYYCSSSIGAVAQRQAESEGGQPTRLIEAATNKALELLAIRGLAERMAARRCEGQIRDQLLSEVPDWKEIMANGTSTVSTSVESPYREEIERFQGLVREGDLDGLVARYPLRYSNVFPAIASSLNCRNPESYQRMLVARIRGDAALATAIRRRTGKLAEALGQAAP